MDNRPIGMFDSGVGGLTVLKEIISKCLNEDIIYLGDTKRFPYGSKSKESIINLTKKGIEFLIGKGVKAVIIACGTATSQALEEVQKCYSIPVIGIIDETVKYVKEKNIKLNFIKIDSLEKAKNAPCVFNNWANFYKGEFISNRILNANALEKLLK